MNRINLISKNMIFFPLLLSIWGNVEAVAKTPDLNFKSYAYTPEIVAELEPWKIAARKRRVRIRLSNFGSPSFTQSMSRRGRCQKLAFPLVALVPAIEENLKKYPQIMPGNSPTSSGLGTTFVSEPTFWIYVPKLPTGVPQELRFSIREQQPSNERTSNEKIFTATFNQSPSIIGLKIPKGNNTLETGKEYQWTVALQCDSDNPSVNPLISGWVRRIKPAQEPSNDADKIEVYESQNVWYDTLTLLERLQRNDPGNFQSTWIDFLTDMGFDDTEHQIPYAKNIQIVELSESE
jgi:Domain of Unknown Function (DUF928)